VPSTDIKGRPGRQVAGRRERKITGRKGEGKKRLGKGVRCRGRERRN
jgi:hypothetical protein